MHEANSFSWVSSWTFESTPNFFLFKEKGIEICFNEEHPSKTERPILVTEDGIEICVSDEHPLNALSSIEVTEGGIVICVSDVHL